MSALIEAAGVEVEPIWPSLFAKALEGKDLGAFLFNVGSSAGAAPSGAPAAAAGGDAPAAEAKEDKKKKEEVKEESDDDMGFGTSFPSSCRPMSDTNFLISFMHSQDSLIKCLDSLSIHQTRLNKSVNWILPHKTYLFWSLSRA